VLYRQEHGKVRHGEEQSPWLYVQQTANCPYTIERWLRPRLGGVPISEVDYEKVLAIQNAVRANGNTEASVRSTGTVLRSILRGARRIEKLRTKAA